MDNFLNISDIPSSTLNEVGYREKNSSKKYNENQVNILNDILDLYNKSNKITKDLNNTMDLVECENKYLELKVNELKESINNMTLLLTNEGSSEKISYVYPKDISIGNLLPANKDLMFNDITIKPNKSLSKVRIENSDTGISIVPASLNTEVTILNFNNVTMQELASSDINNAFDNQNNSVWFKKIVASKSVTELSVRLLITLPENIVSTYDINEISLIPFPINTISINSIKTRISNGTWTELPSFKDYKGYGDNCIKESSAMKFNFKNIIANQIEIIATQKKYLSESTRNIFYIGFSDIEIKSNKYTDKVNFFDFNINIPSNITTPELLDVEALYNNESQLENNNIQYEYYYNDENGLIHKINDSVPFTCPSNKILVKCKIYSKDCTPNISSFKVTYKTNSN